MSYSYFMNKVTQFGYRTLLSSPWYLNYISYGIDWDRYYSVEPLSFHGTESQKRLVRYNSTCFFLNKLKIKYLTTGDWG